MNYDNLYTTSTATTTTADYVYNHVWMDPTLTYSVPKVWKSPALQQQLVEAAPIPENDMAWLKRRVAEISWVPA